MKVIVSNYKKSIYEIGLSKDIESIIWDFYVTKSFSNSSSQKRAVGEFGIKTLPFKEMMQIASIDDNNCKIMSCSSIKKSLLMMGLETEQKTNKNKKEIAIEIDTPKICCLQPFSVNEDFKIVAKQSSADCLFTHIRNAFAHGNTYFFDNGNILLEDKDDRKITARIIIPVQSLIDWIKIIDINKNIYPELAFEND